VTDPASLDWRHATPDDALLLGEMNARLIRDEGSRNRMTVAELAERMRGWIGSGAYRATLFSLGSQTVAYALHREEEGGIHLRQLFVERGLRRRGIGRAAVEILRSSVWPPGVRIRVEVLATNPDAAAFWRAAGFREYATSLELFAEDLPQRLGARDPDAAARAPDR
jgi:GNAT superfamily N-acetyltransferase